jgi:hypothetical protein
MFPVLRSFMPGRKLLIVRNVAVRLPSIDARHSSSLVCSIGPGLVMLPPALATRMFDRSEFPFDLAAHGFDVAELGRVSRHMPACPPARPISASTVYSAPASLPWSATFAPSRANSLAMAAPMPRELPVTNAILSFKRSTLLVLFRASGDGLARSMGLRRWRAHARQQPDPRSGGRRSQHDKRCRAPCADRHR